MAKLQANIRLLTKKEHFVQSIRRKFMQMIKPKMAVAMTELSEFVKERLKAQARMTQTYTDLVYGSLRYELGLVNPEAAMEAILDEWVNNIQISIPRISGSTISLTMHAASADYYNLLSLDEASYETDKGRMIPWLKWLLIDQDLIVDYSVKFKSSPSSRTGGAIMIKTGRSWTIPEKYAGSPGDNFLATSARAILPEVQLFAKTRLREILNG